MTVLSNNTPSTSASTPMAEFPPSRRTWRKSSGCSDSDCRLCHRRAFRTRTSESSNEQTRTPRRETGHYVGDPHHSRGRWGQQVCRRGNTVHEPRSPGRRLTGTWQPGLLLRRARPEQLDRQVRTKLGSRIVPSTQEGLPITPNSFLAVKGPDGSAALTKRQMAYDMALGARGYHRLQSYLVGETNTRQQGLYYWLYISGWTTKDVYVPPATADESRSTPRIRRDTDQLVGPDRKYRGFRQGAGAFRNRMD